MLKNKIRDVIIFSSLFMLSSSMVFAQRNISINEVLSIPDAAITSLENSDDYHYLKGIMASFHPQHTYNAKNSYRSKNLAYFGDWDSNRIFIFDVDTMELIKTIENTGDGPYGIDQQGFSKSYALTRKVSSMTVIKNSTLTNTGKIQLTHKPRSTSYNKKTGLSLVSAADKAMTSIIRVANDKVIKVIGKNMATQPHDYGGSLSTGHPLWLNKNRFFMTDRAARTIELWSKAGKLLSTLNTPTSVHHIFQPENIKKRKKNVYFAVFEGNRDEGISPGIIKFIVKKGNIKQKKIVYLNSFDDTLDVSVMGAHHADFHPDGIHIYVGSAEGHLFVINKKTMKIEKMIETGKGNGHSTFIPGRNIAITTNHNSTYMSVINTIDHTLLFNLDVASSASSAYKSQSHTSGVSIDSKYFYSAASHDGVFFRVNLDTWDIIKTYVGGNILMGSFVWGGDTLKLFHPHD